VFAGASLMLAVTGSRLNIQSLVGLIMASGVAAANAILLTTFAERIRRDGKAATEAGKEAAHRRLRPLLMTSFAMIAGMLPMALGLGEGGEQTAPLGRAVVGGLLASMTAKLLVLPSVFAVVMGRSSTGSASLDPDDPASGYCDGATWGDR
jgi:multidrug efflux pump subunit AcrB